MGAAFALIGEIPADLLGQLQKGKDLAQEVLELFDLGWIEPVQELAIADGEGGDRPVNHIAALIGQLDDHPTAIIGVVKRRTSPRRSSRSMRLVTPADESISPLARRVGESR